jgi:hypothetical protein
VVFVDPGFTVQRSGIETFTAPVSQDQLILVWTRTALMVTPGIASGVVHVEVEVLEEEPARSWADWDDVSEASVDGTRDARLVWIISGDDTFGAVVSQESGPVRVRVLGRGRAANYDGVDWEPLEEYLLQVWPAEYGPLVTLKATTDYWGTGDGGNESS